MAVYHFHFKHGSRAKGAGAGTGSSLHAEYIAREGKYEGRGELAPGMTPPGRAAWARRAACELYRTPGGFCGRQTIQRPRRTYRAPQLSGLGQA